MSPFESAFVTYKPLLCTILDSLSFSSIFLIPSPIASANIVVWSTISLQVDGVIENLWSGPILSLSSVKCFSNTRAPNAYAPRIVTYPYVWSDKPRIQSGYNSRYFFNTFKLIYL